MLDLPFDFESIVRHSERVSWSIDEVMPHGTRLDFTRRFLPETLVASTPSLSSTERLRLNQITANAYLNIFQFVEEFILAMAMDHAKVEMPVDPYACRALMRFAEEEVKHQQLFARYRAAFDRDIGHPCAVVTGAQEAAKGILEKSPMAVLLVTCHLELMTGQHYAECVRDDVGVDPFFATVLKSHWLEEAQHAKIDALELDKCAERSCPATIDRAIDEYLELCARMGALVERQARFDVASLARVTGRSHTDDEARELIRAQELGYRKTFLWFGMTNPTFVAYVERLSEPGARRIAEAAKQYA